MVPTGVVIVRLSLIYPLNPLQILPSKQKPPGGGFNSNPKVFDQAAVTQPQPSASCASQANRGRGPWQRVAARQEEA